MSELRYVRAVRAIELALIEFRELENSDDHEVCRLLGHIAAMNGSTSHKRHHGDLLDTMIDAFVEATERSHGHSLRHGYFIPDPD